MKNHRYIAFFHHFIQKLNQSHVIYDVLSKKLLNLLQLGPLFSKYRRIFVHRTFTEHAIYALQDGGISFIKNFVGHA